MKRKKGSRASQRGNEAKGKDEGAKSNACCPYFDNLPSHLTAHILLKLPIKLEPIFKLPLHDAKSIREKRDEIENKSKRPHRAVRLALEKKNQKVMVGKERVYIACNPDHDSFQVVNSCKLLQLLSG